MPLPFRASFILFLDFFFLDLFSFARCLLSYSDRMELFLGYKSAYEYWCIHDLDASCITSKALPNSRQIPNAANIKHLLAYGIISSPIHLVVASASSKRKLSNVLCHVSGKGITPKAFKRVNPPLLSLAPLTPSKSSTSSMVLMSPISSAPSPFSMSPTSSTPSIPVTPSAPSLLSAPSPSPTLYVASPEVTFLQMAKGSNIYRVLEIGYELCGHYAIHPLTGGLLVRKPRTTKNKIEKHLAATCGSHGHRLASKAFPYLCNGSASPMETKLTLLLALPPHLGGYGLPFPELNFPVFSTHHGKKAKELYRCDLCWPKEKLALEYDSHQFHSEEEKRELDSRRRIAIESHGLHVISVTKQQVYSQGAFNELAEVVAKYLGKRLRITRSNKDLQRAKLRNALFGQ